MLLLVKLSKAFSWDKISQMLNDYPIMKVLCHSVGHEALPTPTQAASFPHGLPEAGILSTQSPTLGASH